MLQNRFLIYDADSESVTIFVLNNKHVLNSNSWISRILYKESSKNFKCSSPFSFTNYSGRVEIEIYFNSI